MPTVSSPAARSAPGRKAGPAGRVNGVAHEWVLTLYEELPSRALRSHHQERPTLHDNRHHRPGPPMTEQTAEPATK